MNQILIRTLACHFLLASIATAADVAHKSIWPFGKSKKSTSNAAFNNINPFTSPTQPAKEDKLFALPSPTKVIDKAGHATGSMAQKTKSAWKGIGRNLNPFAAKSKSRSNSKPKRSMLDRLLPKAKKPDAPTMGEFLTMKRPGF